MTDEDTDQPRPTARRPFLVVALLAFTLGLWMGHLIVPVEALRPALVGSNGMRHYFPISRHLFALSAVLFICTAYLFYREYLARRSERPTDETVEDGDTDD